MHKKESYTGLEVAIIGMSGRFPGSNDVNTFWENLLKGDEGIKFYSKEELESLNISDDTLSNDKFVNALGEVENIELFDPELFGFTHPEAEKLSPQTRMMFECVWECLEDAGYGDIKETNQIGTYLGANAQLYWEAMARFTNKEVNPFELQFLSEKDYTSTLIAHKMNLCGPAVSIQTACSTSLVAVHTASRGLLTGDCEMALAGGVHLNFEVNGGYIYEEGMINSSDGHCRTFDASADGTVGGNGGAVVLLKLLKKAISDGDNIYGIIKGSAINNDGKKKMAFSAPSVAGQRDVIRKALKTARVPAESIRFIEAHGTATKLGDPVEIEALKQAFAGKGNNTQAIAIGSVKSNIGHLGAAAGVAGLIKSTLALKHGILPKSLHFKSPNPKLEIEKSSFFINAENLKLNKTDSPARAGVSSFGIGGTNAHVVLESFDDVANQTTNEIKNVLLLSVHKKTSMAEYTGRLEKFIQSENPNINALAYTFQAGRKQFSHRVAFPYSNRNQLLQQLAEFDPSMIKTVTGKTSGIGLVVGDLDHEQMQSMADPSSLLFSFLLSELDLAEIKMNPGDFLNQIGDSSEKTLLAQWLFQRAFVRFVMETLGDISEIICEQSGILSVLSFTSEMTRNRIRKIINSGSISGRLNLEGVLPFRVSIPSVELQLPKGELTQNEIRLNNNKGDLFEFIKVTTLNCSNSVSQHENILSLWSEGKSCLNNILGVLWEQGYVVNWKCIYPNKPLRISAPTLPFQRSKYWIDTTLEELLTQQPEQQIDQQEWLKQAIWKKKSSLRSLESGNSDDVYIIRNNTRRDWERCIDSNNIIDLENSDVLFASKNVDRVILDLFFEEDNYSNLFLKSSRLLNMIAEKFVNKEVEVFFITSNLFDLGSSDLTNSYNSFVSGLALVGGQEYNGLTIKCIDVDDQLEQVVDIKFQGINELFLAIRRNYLWTRDFVSTTQDSGTASIVKSDETYVITGGFGNIGQVICKHLSSQNCRVVLIGRQKFSALEVREKLESINMQDASVTYQSCDITNAEAVKSCFSEIRRANGKISGVIHGAAILTNHVIPINKISEAELQRQASPKINGLMNINKALELDEADFVLSMSSIATILGGYGFAIYASVNAVMESLSEQYDEISKTRYLSVAWDAWFNEAMLSSNNAGEIVKSALSEEEGIYLFDRTLEFGLPVTYTSKISLQDRLEKWVNKDESPVNEEQEEVQLFERGDLSADYLAPETLLEKEIAAIWSEFFRIDRIGVNDDFYELGGDSLKGMELVKKYSQLLETKVDVDIVFDAYTVQETVEILEKDYPEASRGQQEELKAETVIERQIEEKFSLSPQQRRIYFMHLLREADISYNLPRVISIPEEITADELTTVFNKVLSRHDALKTAFTVENDEPRQYIDYSAKVKVEDSSEVYSLSEASEKLTQPFDLSKAPLIRAVRFKAPDGQYYLFSDLHHIITDGRSKDIMESEINMVLNGKELPKKGKEYFDFVKYQETDEYQSILENERDYWFNEFTEIPDALNLPNDNVGQNVQDFEGRTISFDLNENLSSGIKKISVANKCSSFVTMLSAFKLTLHKLSNSNEIVVGTPVLGRSNEDFANTIGLFVNTLAIKSEVDTTHSIQEYIDQVKTKVINAIRHQELPFDNIVDHLGGKRMANKNPLFDVMFNLQNYKHISLDTENEETIGSSADGISRFDLNFQGMELANAFKFNVVFTKSLFEDATIKRFIDLYINVLKQLVDDSSKTINEIDICAEDQEKQLTLMGENVSVPFANVRSWLKQAFTQYQDREALVCGEERISYRELLTKVHRIEKDIQERNEVGGLIAVCMKPSIDLVATILAIVGRGKAFLPIDMDTPLDRIDYMLTDGMVNLLYTNIDYSENISKANLQIVNVEKLEERSGIVLTEPSIQKETPIYTIYTSGSTGTPKGVSISHENVSNYMHWAIEQTGLNHSDRCLLINNFSFDAVYTLFFGAILSGASLHLLSKEQYLSPTVINEYIRKEEISYVKFTPSMGSIILQYAQVRDSLQSLRFIMIGGEKINISEARKFHEITPSARIMNHYGPTETTIGIVAKEITNWNDYVEQTTIGKAIYNTQLYVLDDQMKMVPEGSIGELYVAGANVSSGYIGAAIDQNSAFRDNPFGNGKVYGTGDLVRWTKNGEILILGRKDDQIKFNGHRIQLSEIEKVVESYSEVKENKIYLRSSGDDTFLVAYLKTGTEHNLKGLRTYLESKLPAYMIPSFFVPVAQFTLNKNGKIDEKNLPDFKVHAITVNKELVHPSNELETTILSVWQEVLGINQISTEDNFFEIGGNSLKLVKLNTILNRKLDKDESITSFFEYPNIKGQAKLFAQATPDNSRNEEDINGFDDILSIIND